MNKLLHFLISLSFIFLSAAFYVAFAGTNDCDHGMAVMIVGFPGIMTALGALLLGARKHNFSLDSPFWVSILILLTGFIALAATAYYLGKTSVGDC